METAKGNGHEPYHYFCHLFDKLLKAKSLEDKRALMLYMLTPELY
ncbi:transposase domain-containing protein [Rectinema subterraneum]